MRRFILFFGFLISFSILYGQNGQYLLGKVLPGEGAYAFLERFGLDRSTASVKRFIEINDLEDLDLYLDTPYRIPIRVYIYNGVSIRSTIGNNDYDYAVKVRDFNLMLLEKGIKKEDYQEDKVLWVPDVLPVVGKITKKEPDAASPTLLFPIFGKNYEEVTIKSTQLTGHVYYVVAGHGGPDPGAVTSYNGHQITEDEYAYDISLRLARNLLEHNATVYVITRDENDGIRNETILKPDKDEVCYPDQTIPLNQIRRLNQRVEVINDLYKKHRAEGVKKQRAIIIHVDSRSKRERIDMFFYHSPKSNTGRELATILRNTIREKYDEHQRGRGYSGTVKGRNLHMLRETHPVAIYAELGNIKNNRDQKRFIIEDNRQAVANWLCEGLINEL